MSSVRTRVCLAALSWALMMTSLALAIFVNPPPGSPTSIVGMACIGVACLIMLGLVVHAMTQSHGRLDDDGAS